MLTDILVKIVGLLVLVGIGCLFFAALFRAATAMWNKKGIDVTGTAKVALDKGSNQLSFVPDAIQERPQLKATWSAHPGLTLRPRAGTTVTFDPDRKEYELELRNDGSEALTDLVVRVQPPHPVESAEVLAATGVDGVVAPSSGSPLHVVSSGPVTFKRTLLTLSYVMTIGTLRPKGSVNLLLIIASWHERGAITPVSEPGRRFQMPAVDPTSTFVLVNFNCKVGNKVYFAPFVLNDETIALGAETTPPDGGLAMREGWRL